MALSTWESLSQVHTISFLQGIFNHLLTNLSWICFLPLYLVGRINLVKMVILPKFLYLFEHIPIRINKSFFNGLDSILRAFIWGNKPARLRKSILQLPKAKGGLSLPNFQQYYWACNINMLLFWNMDNYLGNCPPWVNITIFLLFVHNYP